MLRNRIMKAAMEEINQHGIKFTMSNLARRLGVSKSTLYENFNSKENLIGSIVDALFDDIRQQESSYFKDEHVSVKEKLKVLLVSNPRLFGPINDRVIDDIQRHMPDEWAKIQRFRDEKWQIIVKLLNQGIAEGSIRPINLAVVQKMFIGSTNEILNYSFLTQNNLAMNEALTNMADILIHGLLTPPDN